MASGLLALLGVDENDPKVAAGRGVAEQLASLVETLVHARRDMKLTQSDVAEAMETTQSAVSNFERIGGDPKFSTILRYAYAIGAKVHFKVNFDGDDELVQVYTPSPHIGTVQADVTPGAVRRGAATVKRMPPDLLVEVR